jgi:hypothetical protein
MGFKGIINCFQTLFVDKTPKNRYCSDFAKISGLLVTGIISIFVVYTFLAKRNAKRFILEENLEFVGNNESIKCESSNDIDYCQNFSVNVQNDYSFNNAVKPISKSETCILAHLIEPEEPLAFLNIFYDFYIPEEFCYLVHVKNQRYKLRAFDEVVKPASLVTPINERKKSIEIGKQSFRPRNYTIHDTNEKKSIVFSKRSLKKYSKNRYTKPEDNSSSGQSELSIVSLSDKASDVLGFADSDPSHSINMHCKASFLLNESEHDTNLNTKIKLILNGKF